MNRLHVSFAEKGGYDIVYSTDLEDLKREAESLYPGRRFLVVSDSNVAPLYGESVAKLFGCPVYVIPAGEENKTLDQIRELYRFLVENHYDRSCVLIALGGGVIGDMTGFAAATYMRGIEFIQVPTTLLAQADSSIGGKTGVDFDGYKNMVGAFKMPGLVFANVDFLKTIDGEQFSSGFAEVMKHGLILDERYYLWLLENMYEILDRDPKTLQEMLVRSNEIKKAVVEKDPFEKNERMLLNFGHTIGHAVEKYKNFTMTHGACVALGMAATAFISWKKGYLEMGDMLVPFGLPITVEEIDTEEILALIRSDKKAVGGQVRFVLLKSVGQAFVDTEVTDMEILAALEEIHYIETND